ARPVEPLGAANVPAAGTARPPQALERAVGSRWRWKPRLQGLKGPYFAPIPPVRVTQDTKSPYGARAHRAQRPPPPRRARGMTRPRPPGTPGRTVPGPPGRPGR